MKNIPLLTSEIMITSLAGPSSQSQPLRGDGSQQTATHSSGNTLRRRPRQFGGNIHTLSSEEQDPSDNRNVFWNGNSTEFGGDEKK